MDRETAGDENHTSYFPLLDRIADGHFAAATSEHDLYERFVKVLQEDGHLPDKQSLSAYQLALSLHSAAPRAESHYQYYETAIAPGTGVALDASCPVWAFLHGQRYCSPTLEESSGQVTLASAHDQLPFDRVIGNSSAPASVLYADITSAQFGRFHQTMVRTAREGKTSYRVRHRRPLGSQRTPLVMSGYGVELALKRTDYIVTDDRDNEKPIPQADIGLEEENVADLKPLSTSELLALGMKAASFIMQSYDPLETLVKVSQDFPKYSTLLAAQNISTELQNEHFFNRNLLLPDGHNILWINGLTIGERQVDAFTLLDLLRRERRLLQSVADLGLTGQQAIKLLSHPKIAAAQLEAEPQRFDWRDDAEGGKVIIWLNDIEKDKRYDGWSTDWRVLLQRTFPGQLPAVRREIFNLVIPMDLTDIDEIQLLVTQILSFVKRKLPIRFGIVPLVKRSASVRQAKAVYSLVESYGLAAAIGYLGGVMQEKKPDLISDTSYEAATKHRMPRTGYEDSTLQQALLSDKYGERVEQAKTWLGRLSANSETPPFFIDGIAMPRNENWLQLMSQRVNIDLQIVQRAVYEGAISEDAYAPDLFLSKALMRRNALIVPEDENNVTIVDIGRLYKQHVETVRMLPVLLAVHADATVTTQLLLIADLGTVHGQRLLEEAVHFRELNAGTEITIINNARKPEDLLAQVQFMKARTFAPLADLNELAKLQSGAADDDEQTRKDALELWTSSKALVQDLGLVEGDNAVLLNGRLVGPIPPEMVFAASDLEHLLEYELAKRVQPVYDALDNLGLQEKWLDALSGAKLSSMVARSTVSDVPEGMFEQTSLLRTSAFDVWQSQYTAIEVGNAGTASTTIVAVVDPASQTAQKWLPILKVLSELEGVHLKLYLNPKERLTELPVKRFYRYVMDSKPRFDDSGVIQSASATFKSLPQEALLTVGMDVPSPWLVASKISIHDLDNLKLSSTNGDVEAIYELEHILIEGHSRELPSGAAPRGAQLVLRTESEAHFSDTIIMANLGYFQFKANPGYYNIDLKPGRSAEIFKIDSIGSLGWSPTPGDESTQVTLMSFQGATLYPRLSRRPGMEEEDVLEAKANSTKDYVSRGWKYAENILGRVKGAKAVAGDADRHAEINIFSVASGHLYERMLNIMMVSVMKHTKHTVKFWFIEQFLSPSFKDQIQHLAEEYGFQYQMVTYKWPHWLRAQSEKQREIWGYKILFLDVLFPLSLDKVIFVDADQIVRTDMIELVKHDLKGAPYGFTPMCDSRTEMEGFRFWKQGYWKNYLNGLPYHISALYVVDLHRFRQIAAGDRLRQQYHTLSADPGSLANLDQDLPNHMQMVLPIHSLPQEWLWCETWCSDESLMDAKTIDLCNNPLTKEPKLDRARRQVPEWTVYDEEIAAVAKRRLGVKGGKPTTAEKENTKSRTLEEAPSPQAVRDEL